VSRLRALAAVAFAVAGAALVAWIVARMGPARVAASARELALWAPIVVALEGARIGTEVWTTRALYGEAGRRLSLGRLVRATLVAYPVILLAPAGRLGGEALKATLLARAVGRARAAAAAVQLQVLPLVAQSAVSIPCVLIAMGVWGSSALTVAIAVQTLTGVGLAVFVVLATRPARLGRIVARFSERFGAATARLQQELWRMGPLPRLPLAAQLVGRLLLGAQVILLAHAAGVPRGLVGGLLTLGVHFVGKALGDFVPAQLGTIDGAWAVAAEPLGASGASLVAGAIVFHASQLLWAAVGALAALWGAGRARPA
jgi:hypothetical protein